MTDSLRHGGVAIEDREAPATIELGLHRAMGLSDSEFRLICDALGRHPTYTELGMYAVMWSEHCGYKYSRPVLRLFKTYREATDQGAMENAGVVPIGDGLGVVFKMESHNHPSAVEPFQGAATGVGGILRDIFTMGARPIASMNSIRFGPLSDRRARFLFNGVVEGIAFYGNCVGVPTVGGETVFHPCYAGNPLVNAMAVGLVRTDGIATAAARGVGNPVLLVGARTGRDGIHACSVLASAEISEESLANRPAVQAGDPFTEKLLIEATLEALATNRIVAIQDMGAAGITCATCETAAKGGVGMEIDVLKVPRREADMTPYEVMLSESQERMLAIVEAGHEDEIAAIFHKWELNAVVIGQVTGDGAVTVREGASVVARVPAKSLADECPTYALETHPPDWLRELQSFDLTRIEHPVELSGILLRLLEAPALASKSWVWTQYDHMVQDNTAVLPGSDAAVIRIKASDAGAVLGQAPTMTAATLRRGIAMTTDCNSRYCYLDPRAGAVQAVAEAARNLSCAGAEPRALTDCLNFGNPEKPEVFWQFREAVRGIAEASEAFSAPVVSGNVSFYNETPESAVFPTPTIGMVGVLEDVDRHASMAFGQTGESILLLGPYAPDPSDPWDGIGGSEYLALIHGVEAGRPPTLNVECELAVQRLVRELIAEGHVTMAHDCSNGGLAVALAESAMEGRIGVSIDLPADAIPVWQLFAEAQSRIIVAAPGERVAEIIDRGQRMGVPISALGTTSGDRIVFRAADGKAVVDISLQGATHRWSTAIHAVMEGRHAEAGQGEP